MSRTVKYGAWATAMLACIALGGMLMSPIWAAFDTRYDPSEVVDAKITIAISGIQSDLQDWRKDDTEMWIQYLDSKANHGEADDSDMVLLEAKLRQHDEMLLSKQNRGQN